MGGAHRFLIYNHTLKEVIAASYDLAPRIISGGSAWIDSDRYDMVGVTSGASVQLLGLKLAPPKGEVEVVVIDHVERPHDN